MTQMEKEGFVFQFLRNVPGDVLCPSLPVEPDRLARWILGKEKIDELRLKKALHLFGADLDIFRFLCSLDVLNT